MRTTVDQARANGISRTTHTAKTTHRTGATPALFNTGMPRALAAYRDVGYPYMLMPDHVPQIDGRDPRVPPSPIATATSRR